MEDGKRKKKIKKNKGKAAKTVDSLSVGPGEFMQNEPEVNHESAPHQNHQETETQNAGAQDRGEPTHSLYDASPNSEQTMQTGPGVNMVNQKSVLEQNHQELDTCIVGSQNASVIDSEAKVETHKVTESDLVNIREIIKDLQNNILSCTEKEASLEKKIELLQNENEFFAKKEINWNLKFEQLHSEMHSYAIEEASLENKINSMERANDTWNSVGEMIAKLQEANIGLQMQVKELERSKDNLVQENQQLTSSISLLEARVQLLENEAASFRSSTRMITEHVSEDMDSVKQVEPVNEPSEKLIGVEPDLVGEANRQNGIAEHFATFPLSSREADADSLPVAHLLPHETISEATDKFASSGTFFETISIADVNVNGISDAEVQPKKLRLLDDLHGSAEIVQIPLDDSQVEHAVVDAQHIKHEEKKAVPLSDAPLFGAPFRFVSFVAKYVSGADLVEENMRNSGQ